MRYLRMVTNAGIGGLLGAAYVTLLVFQLNPGLPLDPPTAASIFGLVMLFYGVLLTAGYWLLVVTLQFFLDRPLSPGWLSVRLIAWLGALTAGLAALLMWLNVTGFGDALADDAARRMALASLVTALGALVLLVVAVLHDSFGRPGSPLSAAILVVVAAAAVAVPVGLRGGATMPPVPPARVEFGEDPAPARAARVVLLALDGASLDYVSPAVAEGRLPNLGTILDAGASMHLMTLRPTQPGPVWAAIATGTYPPKNGVASAAVHRAGLDPVAIDLLPDLCFFRGMVHSGLLSETPNDSRAVRTRPLWSILSSYGISVGIVGWPMSYPAQPVRGYLVSDRLHVGFVDTARADGLVHPPHALPDALAWLDAAGVEGPAARTGGAAEPPPASAIDDSAPGAPTSRDRIYRRIADQVRRRLEPQVMAVHYQGLDTVGHRFLRYAMPESFGDVSEEERRRFGTVLDRYYAFIDGEVGAAIADLGPDDLLLVVSGFGMEPVSLAKRLLGWLMGDPNLSGSHERAPDGFLLAYGQSVAPGRLGVGAIVDVLPTLLYFLGLPVARDMDGFARTDVFTRDFTAQQPITFIPTHER